MANPTEVHLTMKTREGEEVQRTIDISNLLIHVGSSSIIARNKQNQRELLEEWIELRGNAQHNTELRLIDWFIS